MADLADWRPFHDAHAIERAIVGVIFSQDITDVPLKHAMKASREAIAAVGAGVFVENPIQELEFAVNAATGATTKGAPKESGIEFVRHQAPNVLGESFSALRNNLKFETRMYTRWEPFVNRAMALISAVRPIYVASVPLNGIHVEYFDRFDALPNIAEPDCSKIIRKGDFIAHAAFSDKQPWHSRSGWFQPTDAQVRRLVNVDVNVADAQVEAHTVRRIVVIRTFMRDTFTKPGFEAITEENVTADMVASRLDNLHIAVKEVLKAVLTDAAAERIALEE